MHGRSSQLSISSVSCRVRLGLCLPSTNAAAVLHDSTDPRVNCALQFIFVPFLETHLALEGPCFVSVVRVAKHHSLN